MKNSPSSITRVDGIPCPKFPNDRSASTRAAWEAQQTFVADARALRTDDFDLLDQAAAAYGASYEISTTESGDVDVGHTAFLYAVDAAGAIRLTWTFGTPPEDLTSDLNYLFDQGV